MTQPPWQPLAARQSGVLSRRQLAALGISKDHIRNQIRAGRWVLRTPVVVGTTTGPPTFPQRVWTAALHAGGGVAVGGLTAARIRGLRNWDRDDITILVPARATISPVAGVEFVRTRRDLGPLRQPGSPLPLLRLEPAVLLFGGYATSSRTAAGVLAAVVQQRLTEPERLLTWLEAMRPLRRAALLRATLADISGGAQSVAEMDVGRLCRRFSLPLPQRQVRRRGSDGSLRFTDCEWRLPDGRVVVLEVDGAFHMDVTHWAADLVRERSLVRGGAIVLRCASTELRRNPERIAADLIALGVGVVRASARSSAR